ncbi:MAG: hypothetical protein H7320_14205, partial [Ferruginibacter sp.]|nr:hypothetical protein [Ferruginibacter sp.]
LIITTLQGLSQGYVALGGTNKGIQASVGVLANNLDFNIKYQLPLVSTEIPKILSFNIGPRINLTWYETDNFNITPSLGYAYLRSKDFSLYNTSPNLDKIILIEEFKPVFNLELGKDWYMGRLAVNYTYCNGNYYGISIKCFFNHEN